MTEIDPFLVNADIQSRPNADRTTTIAPAIASSMMIDSTIDSTSSSEFPVPSSTPFISSVDKSVAFKLNASALRMPNYNDADSDESTESSESNEAYVIPLKIILPVPHVHTVAPENGTFQRFNYILLKINDSAFHEHFAYDKPLHLFPLSESTSSSSSSSISIDTTPTSADSTSERDSDTQTTPFGSDNEIYRHRDRHTRNQSDTAVLLTDSEGYRYQRGKLHQILNETGDIVAEFEDISPARVEVPAEMNSNRVISSARELQFDGTTEEPVAANDDAYDEHYGKMLQWIHYHL